MAGRFGEEAFTKLSAYDCRRIAGFRAPETYAAGRESLFEFRQNLGGIPAPTWNRAVCTDT